MTRNGRELSKKERKRYCAVLYIYTVMILQNALWVAALAMNWGYYRYELTKNTLWCMVVILIMAALLDSRLIGKKYFKYLGKSINEEDKDDDFNKHGQVADPE